MKKIVKLIAGGAIFGVVAGSVFQGTQIVSHKLADTQVVEEKEENDAKLATTNVSTNSQGSGDSDVSAIAEQVLPSIVAIDVTAQTMTQTPFGPQTTENTGSGSGIIIAERDNALYIATNNHVVEDTTSVNILFCDETTAKATIVGTDETTDLAVVKVDLSQLSEETKKSIKIATIGNSDSVKVGERAIAIGNALGYGTSVTVGYVSAKDRIIDEESDSTTAVKLIQTDAAINPGNSGGALTNDKGEVIAINSAKFASEEIEGMGFAIPMATAEPILEKLMNQGGDDV